MAQALRRYYEPLFLQGLRESQQRARYGRQTRSFRKNWTGSPGFDLAFDLFNPRVKTAVDEAVFSFCRATNETSTMELGAALDWLRESLKQGLEKGEAIRQLNARVQRVFDDPYRAARIGQSEAARAIHGGQFLADKESGVVVAKTWLASSDACDECLALNGKEVPLEAPFYVWPKGGPYAVVLYPPLHPHCMCTYESVYGEPESGLGVSGRQQDRNPWRTLEMGPRPPSPQRMAASWRGRR